MKISSKVMKEAHKLTKEIKATYPEVDYKTQLGICIKYLLSESQEEKDVLEELLTIATEHDIDCKEWQKGDKHRMYFSRWEGKHCKKYGWYDYTTKEYSTYDRYTVNYDMYKL